MNSKGEIWALLFFEEAHAQEDLKIVWRVTATGPDAEIQVQAHNQAGTVVQPIWGPEFHPESNWERPGLEWGTGFNFPEPGCWTITVKLGATEGQISLDVLDVYAPQNLQGEGWVIFSADHARKLGIGDWIGKDGQTIDYWTPSENDIATLENGLGDYLKNNAQHFEAQQAPIWERLDPYTRQYIGLVVDGKKIIYANYFCESSGLDWSKDFVFVLDGGDCFFQFKYDVDSGEFFDLQVNGVA